VNCDGEAVTPDGIPVTAMFTCEENPFDPVTLMVDDADDPAITVTLAGCMVIVKSGEGAGGGE
jgi:hypothetical protein